MSADTSILFRLFEDWQGSLPDQITPLPPAGSNRRYYRLSGADSAKAIGALSADIPENESFFYFAELFQKHSIPAPRILGIDADRTAYLQEDAGEQSLLDRLLHEGYTEGAKQLFTESTRLLARIHWLAGPEADFSKCHAGHAFGRLAMQADLNYFRYYFADLAGARYHKGRLAAELETLANRLADVAPKTLMYRDFQGRNILLRGDRISFIDFQGAMQGPAQYDLASLLWQAKAALPADWKERILNAYLAEAKMLDAGLEEEAFIEGYHQLTLLRLLQVLGAYGFRGLLERRPHFLSSIAPALQGLEVYLQGRPGIETLAPYPELRGLLEQLCTPEIQQRFAPFTRPLESPLQISVCSFSYKNGIPEDASGHGGGFVFDCRGLLNPGRFEDYKRLSGQDHAVQEFLIGKTKMPAFLEHVRSLVRLNVEDYLSRGFDHLSIAFGCTGGQHRSVYAADQTAKWLQEAYGIPVAIKHLNKEHWLR